MPQLLKYGKTGVQVRQSDSRGFVTFLQDLPLPVEVLAVMGRISVGDEPSYEIFDSPDEETCEPTPIYVELTEPWTTLDDVDFFFAHEISLTDPMNTLRDDLTLYGHLSYSVALSDNALFVADHLNTVPKEIVLTDSALFFADQRAWGKPTYGIALSDYLGAWRTDSLTVLTNRKVAQPGADAWGNLADSLAYARGWQLRASSDLNGWADQIAVVGGSPSVALSENLAANLADSIAIVRTISVQKTDNILGWMTDNVNGAAS